MPLLEVTDDTFQSVYEDPKNDIIVIDFWAPWCGPCHQFAPIFEETSKKYPEIIFAKVNTESEQRLAGYFSIRSIPTTLFMRRQIILHQQAGLIGEEQLTQFIDELILLDMDQVEEKLKNSGELD